MAKIVWRLTRLNCDADRTKAGLDLLFGASTNGKETTTTSKRSKIIVRFSVLRRFPLGKGTLDGLKISDVQRLDLAQLDSVALDLEGNQISGLQRQLFPHFPRDRRLALGRQLAECGHGRSHPIVLPPYSKERTQHCNNQHRTGGAFERPMFKLGSAFAGTYHPLGGSDGGNSEAWSYGDHGGSVPYDRVPRRAAAAARLSRSPCDHAARP